MPNAWLGVDLATHRNDTFVVRKLSGAFLTGGTTAGGTTAGERAGGRIEGVLSNGNATARVGHAAQRDGALHGSTTRSRPPPPEGGGEVTVITGNMTEPGGYEENSRVTATAEAADGFRFDHWENDGEPLGEEPTSPLPVTGPLDLVAHCTADSPHPRPGGARTPTEGARHRGAPLCETEGGAIHMQGYAIHSGLGTDMALQFIGIDPDTGQQGSPTVWVDEENAEIVFQGWKPGAELEARCAATQVPGHAVGIPNNEAVVRVPARMVGLIREACDVAERRARL